MKAKQRIKLFIVLGIEAIAITVMLLLIFFAGKQVYTVTFDLNGGMLLSGDLVQRVTQGHNATAPTVAKDGHYFLKWSGSYNRVTHDVTVYAVWEYETTEGIEYDTSEGKNYCTISGVFPGLQGEVYVGGYRDGKKVLGIEEGAFAGCDGITKIHLLDGILTIGDGAFAGCTSLESIELPSTAVSMGDNVFAGCESLETIVLPEDLKTLGANAFAGCTALNEVTVYENLERVGEGAFAGCTALERISFGKGLRSLGDNVFAGCTALKEVALTDGLETIGAGAFAGCTELKEITLPATLLNVGEGAFDNEELKIYLCTYAKEGEEVLPETFVEGWNNGATIEWKYVEIPVEEEETETEESSKEEEK